MILGKIFQVSVRQHRQQLMRRMKDWMQDLNFNLCTGKVVRTTRFFEELDEQPEG